MSKRVFTRNTTAAASVREETDGKTYIDFYPAVFNQRSKLIREWGEMFYEVIDPKAFDNVLADPGLNTIHTVNHKREKMLGRVVSGTLKLTTDEKGLKATIDMPDTTLGRDMVEMIKRGDYYECSFIYTIAENGVKYERGEEIPVRTVTNIADLIDTSFVIDGAFANTQIKLRSVIEGWETEPDEDEEEETVTRKPKLETDIDILRKRAVILNL